jgi:hypothetical protein
VSADLPVTPAVRAGDEASARPDAAGDEHAAPPRRSSHGAVAETIGLVAYAVVDWLVLMAPALAVELAADRGGIGDTRDLDLLAASTVIATVHAFIAARRLRWEDHTAARRADIWIASVDALVVLALATTLLVVIVLALFPDEHAALVNQGYPVVVLWIGLQLTAVVLAEVTGRLVFRWLEPQAPHQPTLLDEALHHPPHDGPPPRPADPGEDPPRAPPGA